MTNSFFYVYYFYGNSIENYTITILETLALRTAGKTNVEKPREEMRQIRYLSFGVCGEFADV